MTDYTTFLPAIGADTDFAIKYSSLLSALNLDIGGGGGGGGASTLLDLTDTPSSFAGQGGKLLAVNSGATAVEFIDAPSGSAGGQTCIYAGRQQTVITLSDSAGSIGRTTGNLLPNITMITSGAVGSGFITLTSGKVYTGHCEVLIDSSADDISHADLAIITQGSSGISSLIAYDEKQLSASAMDKVRLRVDFLIMPTSNINVTTRIGAQGTGLSVPAMVGTNNISYFHLTIFEQV